MSQSSNGRDSSETSFGMELENDESKINNVGPESFEEDDEFVWQDYLDVTNSIEVPAILFNHVEQSLLNGLEEGMAMEVPLKDPEKFWLATIVLACGPLLRMRYVGDSSCDRAKEFWCDLTKVVVHPVGWCKSQGISLTPPDELLNKLPDITELVDQVVSDCKIHAPEELLSGIGLAPADRIKHGMKIEIQDKLNPFQLWSGTIVENVGGRIFCRYEDCSPKRKHFWEFYSSPRIFKAGFATEKGHPWELMTKDNSNAVTNSSEVATSYGTLPSDLFQHQLFQSPHEFKVGMKVLAVNPTTMSEISPATVVELFGSEFFLVRIDAYREGSLALVEDAPTWMCNKYHPYILPVAWPDTHNMTVATPIGWPGELRWADYLAKTGSITAPRSAFPAHETARQRGFRAGMKLEAVNPRKRNEVCAATVLRTLDHLLIIALESYDSDTPSIIASIDSLDIFPVGWCESNGYPITPPRFYKIPAKVPDVDVPGEPQKSETLPSRSAWCPKIYFNHKCFTGLLLSKSKLAMLPQSVGPGPVTLVMHEVLGMLLASGYVPTRVLRLLRVDGTAERGMHSEVHKAKYKGTSYSASIAVITSADKVDEFCRGICAKLQVCPNLFGTTQFALNGCPHNCYSYCKTSGQAAKTISLDNDGPCQTAKKRKKIRKNAIITTKRFKKEGSEEESKPAEKPPLTEEEFASLRLMVGESVAGAKNSTADVDSAPRQSSISSASEIKRKYKRRAVPSSDIKTRGAQLPKFSSIWRRKGERKKNGTLTKDAKTLLTREPDASYDNYLLKVYDIKLPKYPHAIKLDSNPVSWSETDIYWYLKKTKDCAHLADKCKEELIDGHSFMLLNLPSISYNLNLPMTESLKLCRHVEDMKLAHYIQYVVKCDS